MSDAFSCKVHFCTTVSGQNVSVLPPRRPYNIAIMYTNLAMVSSTVEVWRACIDIMYCGVSISGGRCAGRGNE